MVQHAPFEGTAFKRRQHVAQTVHIHSPCFQVVASDIDNSLSVQRIVVVCKQGEKPHGKKQLRPLWR